MSLLRQCMSLLHDVGVHDHPCRCVRGIDVTTPARPSRPRPRRPRRPDCLAGSTSACPMEAERERRSPARRVAAISRQLQRPCGGGGGHRQAAVAAAAAGRRPAVGVGIIGSPPPSSRLLFCRGVPLCSDAGRNIGACPGQVRDDRAARGGGAAEPNGRDGRLGRARRHPRAQVRPLLPAPPRLSRARP